MEPLPRLHGKGMTVTMNIMRHPFLAIGVCWVTNPKQKLIFPGKIFMPFSRFQNLFHRVHGRYQFQETTDSLPVVAFYDTVSKRVSIVGINRKKQSCYIEWIVEKSPAINRLEMYRTNNTENVHKDADVNVTGNTFKTTVPAKCIFTLTGSRKKNAAIKSTRKPEPPGWYAGDIHVHLNCGEGTTLLPEDKLAMNDGAK